VTRPVSLDPYVVDVLMRDLVGHDRAPSAFLVYLWLWRGAQGSGKATLAASLQTIATHTGLSKSAVQLAIRRLKQRGLVSAARAHHTEAPTYVVHQPWCKAGSRVQ
jgi:hypothetical protein